PPVKDVLIRTLARHHLSPDDSIDLSGVQARLSSLPNTPPTVDAASVDQSDPPMLPYWRKSVYGEDVRRALSYLPFPAGTVGHFFYHHSRVSPMAGSLQFRLYSPEEGMSGNNVLLNEYGTPWNVPLLAIAWEPRLQGLKQVLVSEGLVPQQLMDYCAQYVPERNCGVGPFTQLVFHKMQTFYVDLTDPYQQFIIA
ncbi:uncharacterized protein BXZ73DRAFT_4371, partial [Epithele typhae]|uniref:uncharacterized protein n=1 Tax=Epithele typhae TaxID=378194 RepID=UPI00200736DF